MAGQKRTLRGQYGARIVREMVVQEYQRRCKGNLQTNDSLWLPPYRITPKKGFESDPPLKKKVCIVGAGASGVYLAWMLSFLNIEYDFFEAKGDVGGRCSTYNFPKDPKCAHNYYDIGAMRIPNIPAMAPTLAVIDKLSIPTAEYYLSNMQAPNWFNHVPVTSSALDTALKPFADAISPFLNGTGTTPGLNTDFEAGFKNLVAVADQFSTREYLRTQASPPMSFNQIQNIETYDTGTGLFDQAFSESVVDWYDFNFTGQPFDPKFPPWIRIEGGMYNFVKAMCSEIAVQPQLNTPVTGIVMDPSDTLGDSVNVTYISNGSQQVGNYGAVFNSTTLGCLSQMDLGDLPIETDPFPLWTAIRSLSYDNAAKVAIKFQTAWWITKGNMTTLGGVSTTDFPIRVTVYPSWMDSDDPTMPAVLIAAYTWHQDATRLGSLISQTSPNGEEQLMQLVLKNLADMFDNEAITLDFLTSQVIDHHAFAWANDPYTAGAFALFGPGQFTSLYPSLFKPLSGSNNKIMLCGEAASAHHAWISGALYSAATSLYQFLEDNEMYVRAQQLKDSWFGGSIQDVPDEMEEDVMHAIVQLGKWKPTDPDYEQKG